MNLSSLSDAEKEHLDEQGFLNLGPLLSPAALQQVRERTDELLELEGSDAGSELLTSAHIRHPREAGAPRLADLVNKGPHFDQFYSHPRVLAGVAQVIQAEFKLSSLNYRAALPAAGAQRLHADWAQAVSAGDYRVCNSIWLLDDFAAENGATRFVPGSHRWARLPEEEMSDSWQTHPDEQLLIAPAGTVVLFNAHLWHGGTENRSDLPRRAIHSYFCRADQPQQLDQRKFLRPETAARLSPDQLRILGVSS